MRSPFAAMESKSMSAQFVEATAPEPVYASEEKPMALDVEMQSLSPYEPNPRKSETSSRLTRVGFSLQPGSFAAVYAEDRI
ncbi:hypothetical protein L1049_022952 [Liquidambar formosana]|uniref:Uncharacterized protein n=1 Tax=Liquidambar formosana TaxID=63359 RepID=A0AAP0RDB4_LIQFO